MHRCERVGGPIKLIADGLLLPGDGYDLPAIRQEDRIRSRPMEGCAVPTQASPIHAPPNVATCLPNSQARTMLLSSCDGASPLVPGFMLPSAK
jgi:hypothetical protein